jgi:metallophosphoesterase (TIGR00282 family)
VKILMIGDIVGRPGRKIVHTMVPQLRKDRNIDFVIANGENAAGGNGITQAVADEIFSSEVDVITGGNHIWDKKEVFDWIWREPRVIRPANYPPNTPGRGYFISSINNGIKIAVVNLSGRVFMPSLDCPFQTIDAILKEIGNKADFIIVDFHGEATSEKVAFGYYTDGRVSAVIGTHTHIQTADARVLPKGTAYITDVGMTGPYESVLGIKKELAIASFTTRLPQHFEVAGGHAQLNAVLLELDISTAKVKSIENIQEID